MLLLWFIFTPYALCISQLEYCISRAAIQINLGWRQAGDWTLSLLFIEMKQRIGWDYSDGWSQVVEAMARVRSPWQHQNAECVCLFIKACRGLLQQASSEGHNPNQGRSPRSPLHHCHCKRFSEIMCQTNTHMLLYMSSNGDILLLLYKYIFYICIIL